MQNSVKDILTAFSAPPNRVGKSLSGQKIAIATMDAINIAVKITFIY